MERDDDVEEEEEETEGINDEKRIFSSQHAACISYQDVMVSVNSVETLGPPSTPQLYFQLSHRSCCNVLT